jgi:hypothetical protein
VVIGAEGAVTGASARIGVQKTVANWSLKRKPQSGDHIWSRCRGLSQKPEKTFDDDDDDDDDKETLRKLII